MSIFFFFDGWVGCFGFVVIFKRFFRQKRVVEYESKTNFRFFLFEHHYCFRNLHGKTVIKNKTYPMYLQNSGRYDVFAVGRFSQNGIFFEMLHFFSKKMQKCIPQTPARKNLSPLIFKKVILSMANSVEFFL